jgi:hypothetical protein
MKKISEHSQDYDRKQGVDHIVKDKAALEEEFIDKKRKDASQESTKQVDHNPDESK